MTVFAFRDRDSLLAVRFAISPAWETQAAVQALADGRARSYHEPWLARVRADAAMRSFTTEPSLAPRCCAHPAGSTTRAEPRRAGPPAHATCCWLDGAMPIEPVLSGLGSVV